MKKEQIRSLANCVISCSMLELDVVERCITKWFEQNPITPQVVGFSDEQVADYCLNVSCGTRQDVIDTFKKWLKTQTFTVPEAKEIIVGLSDKQALSFLTHWMRDDKDEIPSYKDWAKTQTFKVKEVVVGLSDSQIEDLSLSCVEIYNKNYGTRTVDVTAMECAIRGYLKNQDFAQPDLSQAKGSTEPVVVGLSDEQIKDLHLRKFPHLLLSDFVYDVEEWLKTQTFVVQPDYTSGGWKGKYDSLKVDKEFLLEDIKTLRNDYEELGKRFAKIGEDRNFFECAARTAEAQVERLSKMYGDVLKELEQLKAQQFQPIWGDAPKDATEYSVIEYFTTKDGHTISSKTLACFERPTPPAPSVEVGQVWEHKSSSKLYSILALGNMKGDEDDAVCFPEWTDSVTYQCNQNHRVYTRTQSDFFNKFKPFEQV